MIFPPDIQHRQARFAQLTGDERFQLHSDIVRFITEQRRTHKERLPDDYPTLYPTPKPDLVRRDGLARRMVKSFWQSLRRPVDQSVNQLG